MSADSAVTSDPVADAALAAAVFALDPPNNGGVLVRALPGPVRDRWLAMLSELMGAGQKLRRIPLNVSDDRLLGGLDLPSTLEAGRPIVQRGLLSEADGGAIVLAMAERLTPSTAAHIDAALDSSTIRLERDGFSVSYPARIGVIALDEGIDYDERPPAGLSDRLAMHIDLTELTLADTLAWCWEPDIVRAGPPGLSAVAVDAAVLEGLCVTAMSLGINSLRAPLGALGVARAVAALAGRSSVQELDVLAAVRLVLAPRASRFPSEAMPPEPELDAANERHGPDQIDSREPAIENSAQGNAQALAERVLHSTRAALPPGLLARLLVHGGRLPRAAPPGKSGADCQGRGRGRPFGVRRGALCAGARLNVIETLRAAAPWQRLRAAGVDRTLHSGDATLPRVLVRREDFRVTRYRQRAEITTIFAVDASGSSALHRLAEAKGAVELLLAECYVLRNRVAMIAFRGRAAQLLLPPTRSLVRAKRSLAQLPGGGGTPLADGIQAARTLAEGVRRGGGTPLVVLLTDGRANVARDGTGGRPRAQAEAQAAARGFASLGATAMLLDTSPRPQPAARELAALMAARYLALPHADANLLCQAIRGSAPISGKVGARG